ncbi:MAG TPA: hypothetical protein VMB52_06780 [Verrucomicrobiae bacterium]|nr:hypothetical protein [Verrucomicrobiae bacterium]
MLRGCVQLIDKLPLTGRKDIQNTLTSYIRSGVDDEGLGFANARSFLRSYVIGHAGQAFLGMDALAAQVVHFSNTGDTSDLLCIGISGTYAAVNAAVAVRQVGLIGTVNRIHQRKLLQIERQREEAEVVQPIRDSHLSTTAPNSTTGRWRRSLKERIGIASAAGIITACGHLAMSASALDGAIDVVQIAHTVQRDDCVTEADRSLAAQEKVASYTAQEWEFYRSQWVQACDVSPAEITPLFPHPDAAITVAPISTPQSQSAR